MRLRRCGAAAVLVELDSLTEVAAARAALADLPGVVELVPAARTVLVSFASGAGRLKQVSELLDNADLSNAPVSDSRTVVLPSVYDGPDLELVAETAGLSVEDTVALHTSAEYTVAFCGFSPGFAYLTGLPEPLRQPRLDTPRTRVPVGAIGVAGEFTGVYPRSSPGGWRLLGRLADDTDALFDPARTPASLLAPGDRVRFEAR
ncbi:sensor histidine kinase inhibitor, KipI family [Actinokineospora alba]|uniref:Sensor histidine kinase inhibitor, KipI family n=1 Tax=Actinokineospora alba TaxID=504798 RepID=A0A1H0PP84_9PSEU|nr:allophanate hydrolase subunit 1 [Actinokineospora alba]TDP65868.1 KipI family sensor histidine kinase inhibitor [Actinokineospora alba]SDI63245.1 sensor histidine kinase inhibitor, KipI family [Actinokineospora alba]SDP06388.1 sensor histidine kinase inhibitor, KipI family [Actinokineospora alba]